MELNIKFDEKLMVKTANRVLDEYEYNGKTIREWADLLANPHTNADRIRAMTDEELAEFVSGVEAEAIRRAGLFITTGDIKRGKDGWLDWLKQEAVSDG